MKVGGDGYRTIWVDEDGVSVCIIDQTLLPHEFRIRRLGDLEAVARAIETMQVRGAPLIGAAAAYGISLQMLADPSDAGLDRARKRLAATRPTAVNLHWALEIMRTELEAEPLPDRAAAAYARAARLCDEDVASCRAIGEHGVTLIERASQSGEPVNILTHCNAGWLATVDWGTALAPIYLAHERGIPVHVWVDETRPRNQGAGLTAWELGEHGIPHTVVADSAAGHLAQHGRIQLCITGSDRTTSRGDVCNKIGTYPTALVARDNSVPFYVALPHSTIDWQIDDGVAEIPIEVRDPDELHRVRGMADDGRVIEVRVTPEGSAALNYAFDVTPARLVTALITERGICPATAEGLAQLYGRQPARATG